MVWIDIYGRYSAQKPKVSAAVLMPVYDHVTINAQNYINVMLTLLDCLLLAIKADSQQES